MFYKLTLMLTFLFFNNVVLANCVAVETLGAKYLITTTQVTSNKSASRLMVLWRNVNQVAHEYPHKHITELWEQTRNGKLRLVRNFDAYQRGIEYQPNEINKGKGKSDWMIKYQLISKELKNKMQRYETIGQGCNKIEKYTLTNKDSKIELAWLPEQQLVKNMKVYKKDVTLEWDLEQVITDVNKVRQVFQARNNYQTTDYIDIGDNESDPFLLKMMHLGFSEHGSSWVYETRGHSMGGQGHRH